MSKHQAKTDMPTGRSAKKCPKGTVAADKKAAKETRVDAPHILGFPAGEEKPVENEAAPVEIPAANAAIEEIALEAIEGTSPDEQIRLQAAQLGEQLRSKQRELDRREALLNAREAQLESDARTTRLWLSESREELEQRESHLQEKTRRLHDLLEAEESLAAEKAELAELRRVLLSEREELRRRDRLSREHNLAQRERIQAELVDKRRQLAGRGEELDRTHAALKKLRDELSLMHRDALESQLAAEELWTQLSIAAPPAVLAQRLGEIRRRLAEAYRAEKAELVERRRELTELGGELAEQLALLARQKTELDARLAGREQEIERQAASLAAREEELGGQEIRFQQAAQEWAAQRLAYHQEIRILRERLDNLAENGKINSGTCGVF